MCTWFVYILRCADNTFYTGISTDLKRRVQEHNNGTQSKGSKYTKARLPVILEYYEKSQSRSMASKREYAIKRLTRIQKEQLLQCSLM